MQIRSFLLRYSSLIVYSNIQDSKNLSKSYKYLHDEACKLLQIIACRKR
jgi:hypothetical protein